MNEHELKVQQKKEVPHKGETTKREKYFIPAVDIFESEAEVTIIAELPGITAEDVDVTLENDILTIRGQKNETESPSGRILLQEYEPGNYQRRFTVAETINQNTIKASVNNGMLRLVLPKAAPAKPKKIKVQADE